VLPLPLSKGDSYVVTRDQQVKGGFYKLIIAKCRRRNDFKAPISNRTEKVALSFLWLALFSEESHFLEPITHVSKVRVIFVNNLCVSMSGMDMN